MKLRAPIVGALALLAAMGLVACGEQTNNSPNPSWGQQLGTLSNSALLPANATFEAKWMASAGDAAAKQITWAQQKPDALFQIDQQLFLSQGATTYYCNSSNICIKTNVNNPLFQLEGLYNGKDFASSVKGWVEKSNADLSAEGVTLNFNDKTYAGVDSRCVDITANGQAISWCVAKDSGIMTYWSADGATFQLNSFTDMPPASDFDLPPGAKVI
jgi:hypothetical protein